MQQALEEQVKTRTRELTLANKDLTRSNENLQQFAYIASHDLQEPLRKIQSFGTLLSQAAQLTEDQQFLLQRLIKAGEQMSALVRDLLTFSRVATRQETHDDVALADIVGDAIDTLEWAIQQSGAQLLVGRLPVLRGDRTQLQQLFQNLLANALKFVPADQRPVISISAERLDRSGLPPHVRPAGLAEAFHLIQVKDQGIGFDNKHAERIFQVFQRLHGKGNYPGTGIGLAICQRVVENHGGAITASSQPGQGAMFSIYLPA